MKRKNFLSIMILFVSVMLFHSVAFAQKATDRDALFTIVPLESGISDMIYTQAVDVNNDGNIDVVGTRGGENQSIVIAVNDGFGHFVTQQLIAVNTSQAPRTHTILVYQGIAVGDMNGDGYVDIVAMMRYSNGYNYALELAGIKVWLNNGDGTFAMGQDMAIFPAITGQVGMVHPSAITLADMDGDFDLDVVAGAIVVNTGASGYFAVAMNDTIAGSTTLSMADAIYTAASGSGTIQTIVAGDLDANGSVDVALVRHPFNPHNKSDVLSIMLNNGNGQGAVKKFNIDDPASGAGLPSSYLTQSLILDDLDNNGLPDLVVQNDDGYMVFINRSDRPGRFTSLAGQVAIDSTASKLSEFIIADLDDDGFSDMISVIWSTESLNSPPALGFQGMQINFGDGMGGFSGGSQNPAALLPFVPTNSNFAITAADYNNDGHVDLLYGTNGLLFSTPFAPTQIALQAQSTAPASSFLSSLASILLMIVTIGFKYKKGTSLTKQVA